MPISEPNGQRLVNGLHSTAPIESNALTEATKRWIPGRLLIRITPVPGRMLSQNHPGRKAQTPSQMGHGGVVRDQQITSHQHRSCGEENGWGGIETTLLWHKPWSQAGALDLLGRFTHLHRQKITAPQGAHLFQYICREGAFTNTAGINTLSALSALPVESNQRCIVPAGTQCQDPVSTRFGSKLQVRWRHLVRRIDLQ